MSMLPMVGSDEEGVVRAVELPQHNSSPSAPYPLVSAFLSACRQHYMAGRAYDENPG